MKFLDWLTAKRRPAAGTPVQSAEDVRARLIALNRPSAPYVVRVYALETPPDVEPGAELVCEWRMREPAWQAIFGKVDLRREFRVYMRLDEARHEVRSIDRMRTVTFNASLLGFQYSDQWSRGQLHSEEISALPFYEETAGGERVAYRFSSSELKDPLRDTVIAAAWIWRGVFGGRL